MASLGIMTHRLCGSKRFSAYAAEAGRNGFDETFVFTPEGIDFRNRTIDALCPRSNGWQRQTRPFPDVVHDVGFYTDPRTIRAVKRFKALPEIRFTGFGLGNKWQIHTHLSQTEFAPFLPETELYRSPSTVTGMLRRFRAVMIKPINGKRGIGITAVMPGRGGTYCIRQEGRGTLAGLPKEQVAAWLRKRWAPGGAVVQRWMDLRSPRGGVFDIRALLQKEPSDRWRLTEMAVRLSSSGRIASNVSRGSMIKEVYPFLADMYGASAAEHLAGECRTIALRLPSALEDKYGKPLIELGIDLAVEQGGHVRIIEVNIKPGKKIVRALSGEEAYADASLLPIRYAGKLRLSARGFQTTDS